MGIKEESKKLLKHTSVYGLGSILGQFIGFLMLPVYTRYLTPSDYGVMALLSITTAIIGTVIVVGISQAMFRFYYEYEDEKERNEVISTAVISFAVFGFAALSLISLGSKQFSLYILGSEKYSLHFLVCIATIWFATLTRMGMDYIRIQERSKLYLVISLCNLVISLSLNIYFIVFAGMGVMGIFLGGLISAIIFSCVLMIPLMAKTGLHFSIRKCKEQVRFGAPLIVSDVGRTIANRSDRYFIGAFGGLRETGLYSLAYKFGTIAHAFVTSPFLQIWFPRRLASHKEDDSEETFSRIFTYFLCALTFVGLGICVLIKEVIQIATTPAFYEAYKYVPPVIFAYVIFSFYYHFSMALYIEKRTKRIAGIDAVTGIVNVVLNLILIKYFLVWGAIAATILSFIVRVSLTYAASIKTYPIKFETMRVVQLLFCAAVIYAIANMIDLGTPWLNIPCKTFVACLYPASLWATGFLREEEHTALRQVWTDIQARILLRARAQ